MYYELHLTLLAVSIPSSICTASVIWNVPSHECSEDNDQKDLSEYKIQANTGEKLVTLKGRMLGRYPYFRNYNELDPVNGGSPLRADLQGHLEAAGKDIENLIPEQEYDGLAVIDFEEWRPLLELNYGRRQVYRDDAIAHMKAAYPDLTETKATEAKANELFNEAASRFINETLQLGKRLRPKAHWGLYGFPYCNYDAGKKVDEHSCSDEFRGFNDALEYVFSESRALFPSIHLGFSASSAERHKYILYIISEARRFANKHDPPLPIYAYAKFEYDPLNSVDSFYDDYDLCSTVKQTFDLGVDGLVFWSSSSNMSKRCELIQNYLDDKLGPVVRHVIQQHTSCRKKHCSNNGRCVLRNRYDMKYLTDTCSNFQMNYNEYKCICDPSYEGEDCSTIWSSS